MQYLKSLLGPPFFSVTRGLIWWVSYSGSLTSYSSTVIQEHRVTTALNGKNQKWT